MVITVSGGSSKDTIKQHNILTLQRPCHTHHIKQSRHNVLSLWSNQSLTLQRLLWWGGSIWAWAIQLGGGCREGLLARCGCEAPVGPLEVGWLMGRGGDIASLAWANEKRLVGMAEGCWTLAQSGDCLSVQALDHSSLLLQAPTPEWAFQRNMPALSLSITLLPLPSLYLSVHHQLVCLYSSIFTTNLSHSFEITVHFHVAIIDSWIIDKSHAAHFPLCFVHLFLFNHLPYLFDFDLFDSDQSHCGVEW